MVEMQSACFWRSGSTLKPCFSTLTPPGEPSVLRPSLPIQLRNGYSLPENHTPSVRPLRSAGVLTPVSARQVSSRPERLKGWAMLTIGAPFSRAASAPGIQSTTTSAPPPISTCSGAMSGPPGLIVTSSPSSLPPREPVEAAKSSSPPRPIGGVPERHAALHAGDQRIEQRTRDRRDDDRRPHHVDAEMANLGRDAKAHADDWRAEEFRHDRADHRERRIDFQRIEDERQRRGKTQRKKRLPVACAVSLHQVALHGACAPK